jgi:signal transduction histidine kinase
VDVKLQQTQEIDDSMGLTNLQRRTAKNGGSVHIDSAPTQRATLTITLPIHD